MALLVVGSVWDTRLLLGYLTPSAKSTALWLVSWLAAFATALWIPGLPAKSSFLTMGTMIKPSFFIAFAPVMALFLLWDLIRTRGRSLPRVLLFSSSVIPSLAASLYQAHLLFRAGAARDRIGFAFGELQFKSDITLFCWGLRLGCFLLFIAAGAVLAQWMAAWKEGGQSFLVRWATCCLLWGCLIWHALAGLGFFAHFLSRASYGAY